MHELTYAIGDIHGCYDPFMRLIDSIHRDAAGRHYQIITLGDYVDRGPDSKKVVDYLISRPDIVTLRGNHEEMWHAAGTIGGGGRFGPTSLFISNGGDTTLKSFGVESPRDVPAGYYAWIEDNTRLYYEDALRVFVHAGVSWRRGESEGMRTQDPETLLWIREGFLDYEEPFFKYIVHGHTPYHNGKPDVDQPEVRSNRCNLDTGGFMTGCLTAGVFDSTQAAPLRTIQARGPIPRR